ncbi:hypothetical protein AB833_08015 [Chromatiales bacterium (ex Bugula neritina AB1)]|nr:hypothetical protein AB833_08015 [Chromatiales bacterium (ex Bugula neritina AB1)]
MTTTWLMVLILVLSVTILSIYGQKLINKTAMKTWLTNIKKKLLLVRTVMVIVLIATNLIVYGQEIINKAGIIFS